MWNQTKGSKAEYVITIGTLTSSDLHLYYFDKAFKVTNSARGNLLSN